MHCPVVSADPDRRQGTIERSAAMAEASRAFRDTLSAISARRCRKTPI